LAIKCKQKHHWGVQPLRYEKVCNYPGSERGLGIAGETKNLMNQARKIEKAVIKKIKGRGDVGEKKYGQTMDRTDLTPREWAVHFQEEMMDGIQYAERVIQSEELLERAVSIISAINELGDPLACASDEWLEDYKVRFSSINPPEKFPIYFDNPNQCFSCGTIESYKITPEKSCSYCGWTNRF
jgi:hypothetical protein